MQLAVGALYKVVNPCSHWASVSDETVTIVQLGLITVESCSRLPPDSQT